MADTITPKGLDGHADNCGCGGCVMHIVDQLPPLPHCDACGYLVAIHNEEETATCAEILAEIAKDEAEERARDAENLGT